MITETETNVLEKWAQQWGCAVTDAIFDFPCEIFQAPPIEGFIGYKNEASCAVAIGDPVCAEKDLLQLIQAFADFCSQQNLRMIFIVTSEKFATWASQHNIAHGKIEMGEELIFNPQIDPKLGSESSKLRNYLNHTRHMGVHVEEYTTPNKKIENAILHVGKTWRDARAGPQMHLGNLDFFTRKNGNRWFYATKDDNILGMAMLHRLDTYQGWLLKYQMAIPEAPRGTSELLMNTILDTLRQEGCNYLTYGIVPADQLGEISGLGSLSQWSARKLFLLIKWIFKLEQRKMYWKKFKPTTVPSYIVLANKNLRLHDIKAIIAAMHLEFL